MKMDEFRKFDELPPINVKWIEPTGNVNQDVKDKAKAEIEKALIAIINMYDGKHLAKAVVDAIVAYIELDRENQNDTEEKCEEDFKPTSEKGLDEQNDALVKAAWDVFLLADNKDKPNAADKWAVAIRVRTVARSKEEYKTAFNLKSNEYQYDCRESGHSYRKGVCVYCHAGQPFGTL